MGKRRALFLAEARDLADLHALDLQQRSEAIDAGLIGGVLAKMQQLKIGYAATQSLLTDILSETQSEYREISADLQSMRSADDANRYEFDSDALTSFLRTMQTHLVHQRDTALALRMKLSELLSAQPLTALRGQKPELIQRFIEELRQTAMERAEAVHQALEQTGDSSRILEASLLARLEARFNGDERKLDDEVAEFVKRAASCLHLRGDTQPATLLGQQVGAPLMPKRILLLGLPNDNPTFADKLVS